MPAVTLRAPAGCTVVVHDGRSYPVAPDGMIAAPAELLPALAAHGVAAGARGTGIDIAAMDRPALVAALAAAGVAGPVARRSSARLRRRLRRVLDHEV